jgi:peptidoglycan hydrolase CwlO-like protein
MSSKVIDAINASIDIIDAERIQTSAITIGKSQVEGLTGDLNTINQQISGITGDLEDLDNKIDHINDDRNLV